ncbi:LysM peptidoglycan-binding domain-containing protein [Roseibium sp. SCP14]|uniref:LysM peptidoglycan-binding domain-containing protein n=1 Tax=Roseibium sp. SCP14 TaxID=3141375 RepID=UPI00333DE915
MNKQTLIWTLIVAVPVGLAALATGYVYRDTGRLPFQTAEETQSAPAKVAEETQNKTAETAKPSDNQAESATSQVTSNQTDEATAADAAVKGPSFDVVGVEPTGETVVAGRSEAGAIVALTANGEVVGKSIANEAGEWTIILEEPLKPGDYDVGLEVHDDKGKSIEQSGQRLAVSVPEDGKEQPLVVLNSPEGPSDILQKPDTEKVVAQTGGQTADQSETVVAAKTDASSDGKSADVTGTKQAGDTSAQEEKGGAETQVASLPKDVSASKQDDTAADSAATATNGGSGDQVAAAPSDADIGSATTSQSQSTQSASANDAPAAPTEGSQAATSDVGDTNAQIAATTADTDQSNPDASVVSKPSGATVTVEAVESEKDKVYVAGTGEPGSSVRVYVGEEFQGEAQINASGKWLVQGNKNVAEGNVEVRADLLSKDGSKVDARAAVTFEKEQDQQVVLTKVVATGASGSGSSQEAAVQKALPVVIIRKGDNLWRISRRLYGDGVRYTTIYQANQDQIRDPDLIYPGQVFLTPEGDLNWPKPDADKEQKG